MSWPRLVLVEASAPTSNCCTRASSSNSRNRSSSVRVCLAGFLSLFLLSSLLLLASLPSSLGSGQPPSPPPFAPSSPLFNTDAVSERAAHSVFPSLRAAASASASVESAESAERADRELFARLREAGLLDAEARPTGKGQSGLPPGYDATTADFVSRARQTLASVMQHDGGAMFHYLALVARAKAKLAAGRFDDAAPLFKQATRFYFAKLREPYAGIADNAALGHSMQKRLAQEMTRERAARGGGAFGPDAAGASIAAQFRQRELDNLPLVHTALIQYLQQHDQDKREQGQPTAAAAAAAADRP